MRTCHLAKGKIVAINTDSKHVFGCLHDFLHLFAVVNWEAHTKSRDPGSRGNALADHAAKAVKKKQLGIPVLM